MAGEVTGVYGVRGWIKIRSHTEKPETLFEFPNWKFALSGTWRDLTIDSHRVRGNGFAGHIRDVDDRDAASNLVGALIAVQEKEFPALGLGKYYWSQLLGLEVLQVNGERIGRVERLMETGANDVLLVSGDKETLIPYAPEFVHEVDLENNRIVVNWDLEN